MKKLRYGVIGVNGIALEKHLPFYSSMKDAVEVVAACDVDALRLMRAADQYGIPKRYGDWRELLADPEIDFVSVCLPNFLHAPVTVAALRAGKHVHCEKPMAANAADAQAMLDESRRAGRVLMVGHNNRFTPWNRFVKQLADSGALGEVYFAKCGWLRRNGLPPDSWFVHADRSGGGAFIDLGVHYVDLVMHFLGYPAVKSVLAHTWNRIGRGPDAGQYAQSRIPGYARGFHAEDLAAGMIGLETGVAISFEISWASHTEKERCFYELYGTKGGVRMDLVPGSSVEVEIHSMLNGEHVDTRPSFTYARYDAAEFEEFIGCVREGREPATVPPSEAVQMMRIADAVYRSAAEGRQVTL